MLNNSNKWPQTVEEAVNNIMYLLTEEEKDCVKNTPYKCLGKFHFYLGAYIRHDFGLWAGNRELLKSCSPYNTDPDYVSMVIIEVVWARL